MMETYDEDVNENPFYLALKDSHPDLFAQCVSEELIICVPRVQSLPKYVFTIEDFLEHVLKPVDSNEVTHEQSRSQSRRSSRRASIINNDITNSRAETESMANSLVAMLQNYQKQQHAISWKFKTLSHINADYCPNQYVKLDRAVVDGAGQRVNNNVNQQTGDVVVKILFEETFYTASKQKYKVLCIESPLQSKMRMMIPANDEESNTMEELWNITSLRDCIDFLYHIVKPCDNNPSHDGHSNSTKGKLRVLESYDAYIKLFLHNHRTLVNLPLAVQKDLVYTLYLKCLNFAISNERPMEAANSIQMLKLATESFVLNGIYKFLMGAITSSLSTEDAYLNKIIRNLAEIHPQDLDINEVHWDNLTRARQELGRLDLHSSPLAKLNCFRKTLHHMRSNSSQDNSSFLSTDELLPIFIYLIVKTPLSNWNAQLEYLKSFRFSAQDQKDDENTFYIVTLEASLAHLKTGKVLDVGTSCELGDSWLYSLHHYAVEPSDIELAEMFSAIKLGNSLRLEELIEEYEEQRIMQKIHTVHEIDRSQLCHPLCSCEKCTLIISPPVDTSVRPPAVELATENGTTLLHVASIFGRPKIVDYLITHRAPLEAADVHAFTPLHYAAGRGHQNALLLLLHAGANLEALDRMSKTPLHLAAQNGHEGCVKALIYYAEHTRQTLNMSPRDFNGSTPLHDASRWGFQGIVQILVENGASISITNNRLSTPVDCAHDIHIMRILQRSARRRSWVPPNHGDFINIEVVSKEDSDGVVMLISEPTNNNESKGEDSVGSSGPSPIPEEPLTASASSTPSALRARRHSSIVSPSSSLLSVPSQSSKAPKFRRHSSIVAPTVVNGTVTTTIPEDSAVPETLQEDFFINTSIKEQDVRRVSHDESQLLRTVSVESLDDVLLPLGMGMQRRRDSQSRDMKKLFNAIAVPDVPLALFYLGIPSEELENEAFQRDKVERVPPCHPLCPCKRCIAKSAGLGLDINTKNMEGLNPLHLAVQYGLLTFVKILYSYGADMNMCSGNDHKSPFQYAKAKNQHKIAEFLLAHGATPSHE